MIKILIIDDDKEKTEKILKILHNFKDIPKENIHFSTYISNAKKLLRETLYDLVILDLQLPIHNDTEPIPTGGIDLLREIHNRTVYKKPHSIMGLSAYDDKIKAATPLFNDNMWSVNFYNPHSNEWSDRIDRKIEYILQNAKSKNERDSKFNYKLAILTALPSPEFDNVKRLTEWKPFTLKADYTRYYKGEFTSKEKQLSVVCACTPQMGMPATAVLATKMITHFQPEYICMVGITAGVTGEVNLGDIVVADPTWDWASGKLKPSEKGTKLHPDPLPERLEPTVKAMLRDAELDHSLFYDLWDSWQGNKPHTPPKMHVGPCVSGASVVADKSIVEDIQSHNRKLIGLEMEAYGLMHAAAHSTGNKPQAFSMKSVCDFADENKSDDIQDFCAYISANLLKKIALKYF